MKWAPVLDTLPFLPLTHWGWVTHICIGKLTIISSDNVSLPGRRQAIIQTNAAILSIGPLGTNLSGILIKTETFSLKKIRLKILSEKLCPLSPPHRLHHLGTVGMMAGQHDDDVIKWKHFPRYWPFVRGIHRSPVNSPHKGQWRGALMFSLICVGINGWVNNCEAGDLRRYRAHYDVSVMKMMTAVMVWVVMSLILQTKPNFLAIFFMSCYQCTTADCIFVFPFTKNIVQLS